MNVSRTFRSRFATPLPLVRVRGEGENGEVGEDYRGESGERVLGKGVFRGKGLFRGEGLFNVERKVE